MNTGFAHIHRSTTLEEAQRAAHAEVLGGRGMSMPCNVFLQGTRLMLACAMSMSDVQDFCDSEGLEKRRKARTWSFDEALESGQRPIDTGHAKRIADYIKHHIDDTYILGALTLNLSAGVNVYVVDFSPQKDSTQMMGYLVLPRQYVLLISDGQHRVYAISMVLNELGPEDRRKFAAQGISATIIGETDVMQVRQDFADCGKVLQLPASLVGWYDRNHPSNKLTGDLSDHCAIFNLTRTDLTAKKQLSKSSTKLFTFAQIKGFVKAFATGSSTTGDDAFCKKIIAMFGEKVEESPQYPKYRDWLVGFVNHLTMRMPGWSRAVKVQDTEVPALRQEGYVCLSATGISAIGSVAHTIYREHPEDWRIYADRLASLDWLRGAEIWKGSIISTDGRMMTSAVAIRLAITKIKDMIGLPVPEATTYPAISRTNSPLDSAQVASPSI